VVGLLIALLATLGSPLASAQAARPSPAPAVVVSGWTSPSPGGAVGHRVCCAHPDPPRTPGVPYRWCVRHHKCWAAHQFVARHVKRFKHWRHDDVTHRKLPVRFERKARRLFHSGCGTKCTRSVSQEIRRDRGGYEDWVDDSDCVVHGYGCYFPTSPRTQLSRVEKTFLWCGGTIIVAELPGGFVTLGEAAHGCFWGAAYYWLKFWQ
jgi:hypothetical protein